MKYFTLVCILFLFLTACGSVTKYEISVSEYACQDEGGVLKITVAGLLIPFSVECESGKRILGDAKLRRDYVEGSKAGMGTSKK